MVARINPDIETIVKKYLGVVRKAGIGVSDAWLYGSYSTGMSRKDSDIDLALISNNWEQDIIDTQIRLLVLAADVDVRIEPHPFKSADFEPSNPMAKEILETGIRVV